MQSNRDFQTYELFPEGNSVVSRKFAKTVPQTPAGVGGSTLAGAGNGTGESAVASAIDAQAGLNNPSTAPAQLPTPQPPATPQEAKQQEMELMDLGVPVAVVGGIVAAGLGAYYLSKMRGMRQTPPLMLEDMRSDIEKRKEKAVDLGTGTRQPDPVAQIADTRAERFNQPAPKPEPVLEDQRTPYQRSGGKLPTGQEGSSAMRRAAVRARRVK